ncbi:hypothetical protein BC477_04680 [Clavibacter michiganensis subsp. michiganensis]|uniref:Uncharacterized protein n=1 Tax=Clavibacter michiganensis subsp. michiganensis TaxID=33013 RepID=A0A251XLE0_CLAMM|nr:hypothetical protein BC477_04680 [Clavibacter michiganensis subsp. michiganensis]OUE04009.1 hypothetical protein CMMCAS07_03610 [Clavibacter michiganensis subsp. michiganensis]
MQAPVPPEKRGNRVFGVLIAVVAAILFALLYSLGTALLASVRDPDAFGDVFGRYIASPVFYVPTIAFLVFFVLLALLVNRGKWWAFVLGGLRSRSSSTPRTSARASSRAASWTWPRRSRRSCSSAR